MCRLLFCSKYAQDRRDNLDSKTSNESRRAPPPASQPRHSPSRSTTVPDAEFPPRFSSFHNISPSLHLCHASLAAVTLSPSLCILEPRHRLPRSPHLTACNPASVDWHERCVTQSQLMYFLSFASQMRDWNPCYSALMHAHIYMYIC
jgi:hypothetical protein